MAAGVKAILLRLQIAPRGCIARQISATDSPALCFRTINSAWAGNPAPMGLALHGTGFRFEVGMERLDGKGAACQMARPTPSAAFIRIRSRCEDCSQPRRSPELPWRGFPLCPYRPGYQPRLQETHAHCSR